MSKRRTHDVALKARVALVAVKGERIVSELAAECGVHPTMIHQGKKALLEGAAGLFERGGQAAATAEIAEETVRDLHAWETGGAGQGRDRVLDHLLQPPSPTHCPRRPTTRRRLLQLH
jgi:transposase